MKSMAWLCVNWLKIFCSAVLFFIRPLCLLSFSCWAFIYDIKLVSLQASLSEQFELK